MVDLFDRKDSQNSLRGQTKLTQEQQRHFLPPKKGNTLKKNFVTSEFDNPSSLNSLLRGEKRNQIN